MLKGLTKTNLERQKHDYTIKKGSSEMQGPTVNAYTIHLVRLIDGVFSKF